jgi:2-hydroxy-6-oxonona-2,4-dienedioate hydrolase
MQLSQKTAGKGPPLVLLHGGMGSINHWHRNLNVLAQHFTVHALDLPSYGDSPTVSKDTGRDEYVALVVEGLDAAVPNAPFSLAGFSFGGIIAALCAARMGERVRKLSLMGPGGFSSQAPQLDLRKIPREDENAGQGPGTAEMRDVLRHNLITMMCADPAAVTDEAVDLHLANVRRTRYDGRHVSLTPGLMVSCLTRMTCPAQIIWGDNDVMCEPDVQTRADECLEARPDVRIDRVPGAGHWVQYEAAESVNRLMLDFLL